MRVRALQNSSGRVRKAAEDSVRRLRPPDTRSIPTFESRSVQALRADFKIP